MTLSKERLTSIAIAPGLEPCDYEETYSSITTGEIQAMARELLDRRERDKQEPVGYTYNRGINCEIVAADLNADCPCGVDLYAAPPAPVMPDELLSIAERLVERYIANKGTESEFIACLTPGRSSVGTGGVWDDWKALGAALNACRDAKKIQEERDALNSPVTPDGWLLVPEQVTPEMLQAGIAAHYERSNAQIHDRPAPGPMECAYAAMLAAAPKQESE